MARKGQKTKVGSDKDDIVAAIPLACVDETAAVEFMEAQRWGEVAYCPRCGDCDVYKMIDAKTGERNKRYLWRCRGCKRQFTVRIGTVMEESRIPMKHWCYAFWRACTSKKGAAALEIKRHTGLTYKSALFLMHRIKAAMTETHTEPLDGLIEADETYVGGRRKGDQGAHFKSPVVAVIKRNGDARYKVIQRVNAANLREHIDTTVDKSKSRLHTDQSHLYHKPGKEFAGGHLTVDHSMKEYSRLSDGAGCNTCESAFAVLKRGINGIYHSVSKHHLHRYVGEFEFRWNHRKLDDGPRVVAAIRGAEGKRLMYKGPIEKRHN